MGLIWTCIEHISFLLEPAEREAILGDLRERNVTSRDLADTIGLVLSRQFGAWFSPRPWLLSAAFFIPTMIAGGVSPIAPILYSGQLLKVPYGSGTVLVHPLEALAGALLSWALGFTLGRLGGPRLASLLALGLLTYAIMAYRIVASFATLMGTFGEESLTPIWATILATFCWAAIPLLHGYFRSLRNPHIAPATAWLITIGFFATSATQFHTQLLPKIAALFLCISWPALYLILVSHRRDRLILTQSQ